MRIAPLCLRNYHSRVLEKVAVTSVKLLSGQVLRPGVYDGQQPGVKL